MKISGIYYAKSKWEKPSDYTQSPFRYPGGKYYALKYIIPFIDAYEHELYIEPFAGGGSVFFGKKKAKQNWLNDLDHELIETYKAIKNTARNRTLIEKVTKEIATKERHAEIVKMAVKDEDDVAFKTYYLNRTSYSGIIHKPAWGYAIGASSPPTNWHKFLKNANIKLKSVELTSIDFEEIFDKTPANKKALFYLDPPYYLADQKRAYRKSFEIEDHKRLADRLVKLKHAFVLSYDDCQQIRKLYNWANIYERSWFYNTANSTGPRTIGKELIITNFKVKMLEQRLLFDHKEANVDSVSLNSCNNL